MHLWYLLNLIFTISYALGYSGDLLKDHSRIILGEDTSIEKVPWQVSLHNELAVFKEKDYFCGGAIIGTHEILTAAHCVRRYKDHLYARAGSTDRQDGGTVHNIINVTIHKDFVYSGCAIINDVAFLQVREPFQYGKLVKSIEIADTEPENGDKVMVTGWGRTSSVYGKPRIFPMTLQQANLSVWHQYQCFYHFGVPDILRTKVDMKCMRNIPDTFQQTCEGDSGSPVVKDNKLVGVVSGYISDQIKLPPERECGPMTATESNQISCNHPKTIAIYNSVIYHKKWILKLLNESRSNRENS